MLNDIKIIISFIFVIALVALAGYGYTYVLEKGKHIAEQKCAEEKLEYQQQLQQKITELETQLSDISVQSTTKQKQLTKTINNIKQQVKKEPVTIIKNSECIPSENFINSINQAISKANQE
jgi:predicted PurR-regulated permease PerM